jgi:hypothetical protein
MNYAGFISELLFLVLIIVLLTLKQFINPVVNVRGNFSGLMKLYK